MTSRSSDVKTTSKIVIICLEKSTQVISHALIRLTSDHWKEDGFVVVISVKYTERNDTADITSRARKSLQQRGGGILTGVVIICDGISIDVPQLGHAVHIINENSAPTMIKRTLPHILSDRNLDWLSLITSKLHNGWHFGIIDRNSLERWIRQFDLCGNNGWIAEGLLKSIDFWSDARTSHALNITDQGIEEFDCICVNRKKHIGKSADSIAPFVKKTIDSGIFSSKIDRVLDFSEAIDSNQFEQILFIEDCLITGNEMTRILNALQSHSDHDGALKADPLKNVDHLFRKKIVLRFAVVTNAGIIHINNYINKNGLTNISVDLKYAKELNTLTADGINALNSDCLYDDQGFLVNPESHINRPVFDYWKQSDQQKRAKEFCTQVGYQLYSAYERHRQMKDPKRNPKSDRWISEAALGVRSFALSLAFSHSVPKETLPLFWMRGAVRWQKRSIEWQPLFDKAM